MALRAATFVTLLAVTALSGCSEGGSGGSGGSQGYPQAYMAGSYSVPDGYVLMDEDSDGWQYAQEFGLDSNPGYADPEAFAMDEEGEEADDGPMPKSLYVAIYIEEGYDPEE